jgi:hypothetical protein
VNLPQAEVLEHLKVPGAKLGVVAKKFGLPDNTLREWTKVCWRPDLTILYFIVPLHRWNAISFMILFVFFNASFRCFNQLGFSGPSH